MDEDLLLKVLFTSLLRENFWIMVIVNLDYERFFRIVYNLILLEFRLISRQWRQDCFVEIQDLS